jgi:superoxide dismutase, Fe-Mn family
MVRFNANLFHLAHFRSLNLHSPAIDLAFGSFNDFKQKFHSTSTGIYGSGWSWLCVDPKTKHLVIRGTPNQDNPLSDGFTPILGLDVWEHAYFLKYHYQRGDYINNWFHVVNWSFVEQLYEQASK